VTHRTLRAAPDGVLAAEGVPHGDAQPRAAAPSRRLGELQGDALEADDIVAADDTLGLGGEELIEVHRVAQRDEGAGRIGRRAGELGVVVGKELLAQVGIGGLEGGDPREPELVDQAALEGAVEALDPAAGLGRIARDVVDAEAGQDAADDGEVGPIDAGPGRGRVEGPAGAVGVQGHGQPEGREDGQIMCSLQAGDAPLDSAGHGT
jgi:hypothetical protein